MKSTKAIYRRTPLFRSQETDSSQEHGDSIHSSIQALAWLEAPINNINCFN